MIRGQKRQFDVKVKYLKGEEEAGTGYSGKKRLECGEKEVGPLSIFLGSKPLWFALRASKHFATRRLQNRIPTSRILMLVPAETTYQPWLLVCTSFNPIYKWLPANVDCLQLERSGCKCVNAALRTRFTLLHAYQLRKTVADIVFGILYRTRKIKEVDFGFSFGLAPPINETVQPASQPSLQPPAPSHTNSEPENTQSQSLTPQKGLKASQSQGIVYRSPGSSRNDLPERPSLFDIPQDDPPLSERSRKRRKIGSCTLIVTI